MATAVGHFSAWMSQNGCFPAVALVLVYSKYCVFATFIGPLQPPRCILINQDAPSLYTAKMRFTSQSAICKGALDESLPTLVQKLFSCAARSWNITMARKSCIHRHYPRLYCALYRQAASGPCVTDDISYETSAQTVFCVTYQSISTPM